MSYHSDMLDTSALLQFSGFLLVFLALNYVVFAYGGYWFFYRFLGPDIQHRSILEKLPTDKQMRDEKRRSFLTTSIFFFMGLGLYIAYKLGWTQVYSTWNERGVVYFILSYFIMHQLHDAYFYWTHRLMHEWKPIRKFHFVHHESSSPNPYSSFSFHPVEAVVHGIFWYLIAFLIPMPAIWLFVFYIFMFYINMWGHTNFEFWHRDLLTHPILKHLNTPTHHALHHKYHNGNFGIYYNFWDKICGTNHAEYENHYVAVKLKTELAKTNKLLKMMKL